MIVAESRSTGWLTFLCRMDRASSDRWEILPKQTKKEIKFAVLTKSGSRERIQNQAFQAKFKTI